MIAVSLCLGCESKHRLCSAGGLVASSASDEALYVLPDGAQTHWASAENWKGEKSEGGRDNAGRKGSPSFKLGAGESKVLAEVQLGSGMVRRIWITINDRSAKMLRGIRLDMYWDGASRPAVSAPIGDFFGHGLGQMATFQSAMFSSPEGRSFNCCAPMPFRKGMKIVITNETNADLDDFFYDVDYTTGDNITDKEMYFHAHWNRENPTTLQKDFEILPTVLGKGRFIGANIGVIANQQLYFKSWWGEGEVKVYLDGDKEYPTLCGTGTEDYIGSGWGMGLYANLYQGCTLADWDKMRYCFYRLHIPDPIYFRKDVRVTMHQIGCWDPNSRKQMHTLGKPIYANGPGLTEVDLSEGGNQRPYGLFERQDDWSCCAYFYLDKPMNNLPELAPVGERIKALRAH